MSDTDCKSHLDSRSLHLTRLLLHLSALVDPSVSSAGLKLPEGHHALSFPPLSSASGAVRGRRSSDQWRRQLFRIARRSQRLWIQRHQPTAVSGQRLLLGSSQPQPRKRSLVFLQGRPITVAPTLTTSSAAFSALTRAATSTHAAFSALTRAATATYAAWPAAGL